MADLKISALTASTTPLAGTEVLPIVQSSTTKKVSVANLTDGRNTSVAKLMVNSTGGTAAVGVDIYNESGRVNAPIPGGTSREWPIWRGSQRYNAAFDKGIVGIYMYSNSGYGQDGGMRLKTSPNDVAEVTAIDIDISQNVTVSAGNLVIGTSGKGIDFSATPGTGTSELFADYEEGDWTPAPNSGTFSSAIGKYTKVGRMVTLTFDITVGTGGGTTMTAPIASAITTANGIYASGQVFGAGTTSPTVVMGGSGSTIYFRSVGSAVGFSAMTLTASASITGTLVYFV
jgi:hypothetical protein